MKAGGWDFKALQLLLLWVSATLLQVSQMVLTNFGHNWRVNDVISYNTRSDQILRYVSLMDQGRGNEKMISWGEVVKYWWENCNGGSLNSQ